MVVLHRQAFNAMLQEYMASKANNMTLLFESEYAQALELRIYDTLEERKKAAPIARKFELLTRGGGQVLVKRPVPPSGSGSGPCASLTPEEEAIWLAVAAAEAENEHQLDQQADERRDTLQAAAAPAELGAAGANEWVSNAKTEMARILVVVCGSSQGQAPSFRSGCGVLSDLVALSGEAYKAVVEWNPTVTALRDAMAQLHSTLLYFVCPVVDTGDGSSGGLSLGALRLGGGNLEAGGVATQEEIAECTCSGGSTCQEEVPVEMAADGSVASTIGWRCRPYPKRRPLQARCTMLGVHRHRGE
eukprot:jgi/Tetstr1/430554/TSEL_020352.t1